MSKREDKVALISKNLQYIPDFPKPGITFCDIFSVLGNTESFAALYDVIATDCESLRGEVTVVCGLDSRGFLFGPTIAKQLNVPFVPIRKKGKLPGETISVKFQLEYGSDEFEVQTQFLKGAKTLIVDDLLATGGSLKAACSLVEKVDGTVIQCLVILEIAALNGRANIPYPINSIIKV